jgi:protein-S-isoprenylcysteine O-methyltransferase Ste14
MTEEPNNQTGVRIPPPILTLLHLIAAFVLGWLVPLSIPGLEEIDLLGWILVGAGLGLLFSAVSQFNKAETTLDPFGGTTKIVIAGPYRFSRNPIYLGFVCMLIGFPLMIDKAWGLILAPLLMILMTRLVIEHEEAYLEQKFGQEYLEYKSRVRRWL